MIATNLSANLKFAKKYAATTYDLGISHILHAHKRQHMQQQYASATFVSTSSKYAEVYIWHIYYYKSLIY